MWAHNTACTPDDVLAVAKRASPEEAGEIAALVNRGGAASHAEVRTRLKALGVVDGDADAFIATHATRRRGLPDDASDYGLFYRTEKVTESSDAARYAATAPGRRVNGDTVEVPALAYKNPNAHGRARDYITWDGVEGTVFINRKLDLYRNPRFIQKKIVPMARALRDNPGTSGRIELPDAVAQKAAQQVLVKYGLDDVLTATIVAEPGLQAGAGSRASRLAAARRAAGSE